MTEKEKIQPEGDLVHTAEVHTEAPPKGRETFPFLEGVAPEDTFTVARAHLADIFSDKQSPSPKLVDKKGNDLLDTYGQDACLSVLARTEHIATELKKVLEGTSILDKKNKANVTDETVEAVRKLLLDLTPLGGTASEEVWKRYPESTRERDRAQAQKYGYDTTNASEVYLYPDWDQMDRAEDPAAFAEAGTTPQELNFYHRLMTHVTLTPIFIEKMLGPINQLIEKANRGEVALEEGPFGYLRQEDGTYKTIDVNRMKVRMLLHDIGRWATHHQYLHESLPDLIAHYLGFTPPLIQYEFDHELRYFSEDEAQVYPENIKIEETVFHFVDFNTKRADEGDLESTELRELEQLVEHAIVRAVGYNGKQREYREFVDQENPNLEEKVKKALELLTDGGERASSHQIQFVIREIIFLQRIIPFFNGNGVIKGVFEDVGARLEDVIRESEAEFEQLIDTGDFYAYRRSTEAETPKKRPPLAKRIRYALEGLQIVGRMVADSIKPRRK